MQSLLAQEKGQIQKDVNIENAELLAKHQKELEELKARFTVEESVRQMLTGSFSSAQSKVFERRLSCIEELWKAFYILRDSMPSFLTYVDIILENEYEEWIKRTDVQEVFGDLSMEKITHMSKSLTGDIEKVRPFVGEYLCRCILFIEHSLFGWLYSYLWNAKKTSLNTGKKMTD